MKKMLCLILFMIVLVASGFSAKNDEQEQRKAKFLSFTSVDDDFKVALEFSVPFLSIPVKKFMNSLGPSYGGLPSINVNTGSLVLGGVFILTTTFILPLLLKHKASHYRDDRLARALDSTEFSVDSILDLVNNFVAESEKLSGCPHRLACWMGKDSYKNNAIQFWNQISSDPLLSLLVNTSSIYEALTSGRTGFECSKYAPCPLKEEHSLAIIKNLELLTDLNKQP